MLQMFLSGISAYPFVFAFYVTFVYSPATTTLWTIDAFRYIINYCHRRIRGRRTLGIQKFFHDSPKTPTLTTDIQFCTTVNGIIGRTALSDLRRCNTCRSSQYLNVFYEVFHFPERFITQSNEFCTRKIGPPVLKLTWLWPMQPLVGLGFNR